MKTAYSVRKKNTTDLVSVIDGLMSTDLFKVHGRQIHRMLKAFFAFLQHLCLAVFESTESIKRRKIKVTFLFMLLFTFGAQSVLRKSRTDWRRRASYQTKVRESFWWRVSK